MNFKTKFALWSATGLLSMSGIVGYGTYALFTAQSQNNGNVFTAGKLVITPERDDIPQVGPMFYSDSTTAQSGVIPTGLWAPGDKHTRGLFLENNGSLSGRLTTLSAFPADASGNALTSSSSDSTDYNNDLLFAKQSNVTIWRLVAVNPSNPNPNDPDDFQPGGNSSNIETAVDQVNVLYQEWVKLNPTATPATNQAEGQALLAFVNQGLLKHINSINAVRNGVAVTDDSIQVVQMANEPLMDLINTPVNVQALGISDVIRKGQSSLLAFTVSFDKEAPKSVIDQFNGDVSAANNSMQGKSVYFNFGTDWVQVRNNPALVPGMVQGSVYPDSWLSSSSPATNGIWNTATAQSSGAQAPNGVPLIFSTSVNVPAGTTSMTVKFNSDDVSELYIDGQPVWVQTAWNNEQSVPILNLSPGWHTVQFFAENTNAQNPVTSPGTNPAVLNAVVYDANNNVLSTTANPSQWAVQQPASGLSTFVPYMFGGTSQTTSGVFVPGDATYSTPSNPVTTGIPIGPSTLP